MTYQRKWPIVLLATTISSFTTPFMGSSVNVALPAIGRDFSMDALSLSWVASSFLLAAAIMLVPLGRLADLFGRRIFFLSGSLIFSLSSLLSIWPETESLFIALRVVQGIGAAMVFSTGTALLVSAYPAGERGKMLGINIAAVYTGLTAGPFIGGLLTSIWDGKPFLSLMPHWVWPPLCWPSDWKRKRCPPRRVNLLIWADLFCMRRRFLP